MIDLSILICSVGSRLNTTLPVLIKAIDSQVTDKVEYIVSIDNKKRSVGEKRNDLLNQSQGKYVAFIDDDDMVEPNYVSELLEAQKENTDVIVFGAYRYVNMVLDREVKYGIQYRKDSDDVPYYYRIPNHLMCFKRHIALQIPYPYISYGEDSHWARHTLPHIKSQKDVGKVLYHYYFSPENTETQK